MWHADDDLRKEKIVAQRVRVQLDDAVTDFNRRIEQLKENDNEITRQENQLKALNAEIDHMQTEERTLQSDLRYQEGSLGEVTTALRSSKHDHQKIISQRQNSISEAQSVKAQMRDRDDAIYSQRKTNYDLNEENLQLLRSVEDLEREVRLVHEQNRLISKEIDTMIT